MAAHRRIPARQWYEWQGWSGIGLHNTSHSWPRLTGMPIVAFPSRTAGQFTGPKPERRRVVVVGAGAAGLTAALHLGEHSLLLEQRPHVGTIYTGSEAQGGSNDCTSTLPVGAARTGVAGGEDRRADRQRPGLSTWERQEIARTRSPPGQADRENGEPIVVARWVPPQLAPTDCAARETESRESLEPLIPLLRGELRLGARVTRIAPSSHRVELADGHAIVYDKLVCGVSSFEMILLLQPELPDRIRSHQGLMYWLAARDVELVDDSTQFLFGDVNPFAAGRRVAETVKRALAQKFRPVSDVFVRGEKLFVPRLVDTPRSNAAAH
jgi:hypothetical protein